MTPDDEALARLRAALHTIADRTPISAGRLNEVSVAATERHNRPVVTIVSAAAAVAAIAAVSAVVVGTHSSASHAILPGAAGAESSTPTPIASPVASPVASAVPSPVASAPAPVASVATTSCVPENYHVIASPSEVAGLTYMLPATPAGYVLYGAWGTISRNLCADSVTWYVEYDPASGTPGDGTNAYQVTVTKVGGDSVGGDFSSARPVASTPITVNGVEGYVFNKDNTYASIGWTNGGAAITFSGPSAGGVQSLVKVADSLALLSPNDPRIVAPANCQVPAGSVCGSDSPTPIASASPSPSPTPAG
ncbi:MAG TPA: hypothetical protein VFG00_07480 [Acidothermaceae bacterium]|nr:hypothetical protein [Acidothermaceae bacterium]